MKRTRKGRRLAVPMTTSMQSTQQLSLHNQPSSSQLQPNPSLDCNAAAAAAVSVEGIMKNIRKGRRLVRPMKSSMQSPLQLPSHSQPSSNLLQPNPSLDYNDAAVEDIMKHARKGRRLAGPMTTHMQSSQQLPLHNQPSSSQLQPNPSIDCNYVAVEDIMKHSRKGRHLVSPMTISMQSLQQLPLQNQPSSSQLQPNPSVNCSDAVEDITNHTRKGRRLVGPMTISMQSSQQLPSHKQPSSSQLQPNQSLDCNDAAVEDITNHTRKGRRLVGPMTISMQSSQQLPSHNQPSSSQLQPNQSLDCNDAAVEDITNRTRKGRRLGGPMTIPMQSLQQLPSHNQPSSSQLQSNQSLDCNDATVEGIGKRTRKGRRLASSMTIAMQSPQQLPSHSQPSSSQLQPNPSLDCNESSDAVVEESLKKQRRTRGPTRCLGIWSMSKGERISVPLNDLGQPIERQGGKLARFLGTIARKWDILPINYSDWRDLPKGSKEDVWNLVLEKFDLPKHAKDWVLQSIGKKWKEWKGEIKRKHYTLNCTDQEHPADPRINPEQWKALVQFWDSSEGQERSKRNQANRGRQTTTHTAGSKSFARLREEERQKKPNGAYPTRADIYILTHTRKDGCPMNEESATTIAKLNEQATRQPQESQCSNTENDIFSQVVGEERHGRVRTYGLGPSPSDIWGTKPRRVESMRIALEARSDSNEELRGLKEQMKDMMLMLTQLQEQMNTRNSLNHQAFQLQQGAGQVFLLSPETSNLIVAKGSILCKNQLAKVRGVELGFGYWEVYIVVPMVGEEPLPKPDECFKTVGDAVGASVAWPSSCVLVAHVGG